MKLNKKSAIVALTVVTATVMMASAAFAAKPTDNTRPGWGYGDNNHTHTGPPGSVNPHRP